MKQPEKTCLYCHHGSFEIAQKLVGRTKHAMGCRAAVELKDQASTQPINRVCRNGKFQRVTDELLRKREQWIANSLKGTP